MLENTNNSILLGLKSQEKKKENEKIVVFVVFFLFASFSFFVKMWITSFFYFKDHS